MSASKLLSSSLLVLALSACTMAPDYERPEFPVSAAWPQEGVGTPDGDVTSLEWQAFFRSEPMRKIIATALEHNRDLRIAALQVERIGRTSCVFQPVRDTAKSDKGASIKSLEG